MFVLIGIITLLSILVGYVFYFRSKRQEGNGNQRTSIITLKNSEIKHTLPLLHKENVSHDTRRFRFQLPSCDHVLGLSPGQHIYLTVRPIDNDQQIIKRPYSPVTTDNDARGYFDLVIKIYPNGKMTQYLDKLELGKTVEVSGPTGNLLYKKSGLFHIRGKKSDPYKSYKIRSLGLIAGGTGITPLYQLINQILKEKEQQIKVWLLFSNRTEQDILLYEELKLLATNSNRFHLWFTLSDSSGSSRDDLSWNYSRGRIDEQMIREHMPPPGDDVLICCCGPPPMIKYTCVENLNKIGYAEHMRYVF